MKKLLLVIVVVVSGSVSPLFAQQGTLTKEGAPKSFNSKKSLSMTFDTQWINGIREFKVNAARSSSNMTRFYLGAQYIFSDITTFTVRFPVVFHQYDATYNFPGLASANYSSRDWYTDRLQAGIDGKLFLRTAVGQVSWFAIAYFPTMTGYQTAEPLFYNHTALKLGFKNLYSFMNNQTYVLGSTSYTMKFKKEYKAETRDYGDEISASLGVGHLFSPKISPLIQLQYAYVFPLEKKSGNMEKMSQGGASALHLVPSLVFPLTENFSIRSLSKILLYRDKINKQDAGYLWGNFEDEGDFSIQLGVRVGIL